MKLNQECIDFFIKYRCSPACRPPAEGARGRVGLRGKESVSPELWLQILEISSAPLYLSMGLKSDHLSFHQTGREDRCPFVHSVSRVKVKVKLKLSIVILDVQINEYSLSIRVPDQVISCIL